MQKKRVEGMTTQNANAFVVNNFIELIQEAVVPYLNYSFIIAEQQPACGL